MGEPNCTSRGTPSEPGAEGLFDPNREHCDGEVGHVRSEHGKQHGPDDRRDAVTRSDEWVKGRCTGDAEKDRRGEGWPPSVSP